MEELHLHNCNQQVNGGVESDSKEVSPYLHGREDPYPTCSRRSFQLYYLDCLSYSFLFFITNKFFLMYNMNLWCFSSSLFLLVLCSLDRSQGFPPFPLLVAFYIQEECNQLGFSNLNNRRSFSFSFSGYLLWISAHVHCSSAFSPMDLSLNSFLKCCCLEEGIIFQQRSIEPWEEWMP